MMTQTPTTYLDAHAALQLGTYLDSVTTLSGGARFVSSRHVADHYWNYAYGLNVHPIDLPASLREIRGHAQAMSRPCVVYVTPDTNPSVVGELVTAREEEEELWMTLASEEFKSAVDSSLEVKRLPSATPSEDFISVFRDAYGGVPGSPGYAELPSEYTDALTQCSPRDGVVVVHLIGFVRSAGVSMPVAIASIFLRPPLAGLYNVGTVHSMRRRRFGSVISSVAAQQAFSAGCSIIFLQTQPDSPVEALYRGLGFKREFLGRYLLL